ncbi:hypothetical protein CHUAL_012170 [Chamberlinius hualienensis]
MMVLLVIVIIMTIDMTTIAEDDVLNACDCVFAPPRDTQCPERGWRMYLDQLNVRVPGNYLWGLELKKGRCKAKNTKKTTKSFLESYILKLLYTTDKPSDNPTDKPTDKPTNKPADRRVDIPNSNVGAKPTEIPPAKPTL